MKKNKWLIALGSCAILTPVVPLTTLVSCGNGNSDDPVVPEHITIDEEEKVKECDNKGEASYTFKYDGQEGKAINLSLDQSQYDPKIRLELDAPISIVKNGEFNVKVKFVVDPYYNPTKSAYESFDLNASFEDETNNSIATQKIEKLTLGYVHNYIDDSNMTRVYAPSITFSFPVDLTLPIGTDVQCKFLTEHEGFDFDNPNVKVVSDDGEKNKIDVVFKESTTNTSVNFKISFTYKDPNLDDLEVTTNSGNLMITDQEKIIVAPTQKDFQAKTVRLDSNVLAIDTIYQSFGYQGFSLTNIRFKVWCPALPDADFYGSLAVSSADFFDLRVRTQDQAVFALPCGSYPLNIQIYDGSDLTPVYDSTTAKDDYTFTLVEEIVEPAYKGSSTKAGWGFTAVIYNFDLLRISVDPATELKCYVCLNQEPIAGTTPGFEPQEDGKYQLEIEFDHEVYSQIKNVELYVFENGELIHSSFGYTIYRTI